MLTARDCQECGCHEVNTVRSLMGSQPFSKGSSYALGLGGVQGVQAATRPGASGGVPVLLEVGVAEGFRVCHYPDISEARLL